MVMNIRKVKRKCGVRGCKNTDCFAISKVREVGNSIIICSDCLKDGLEAVKGYVPEPKREYTPPPPLFYNSLPTAEESSVVAEAETAAVEDEQENNETETTAEVPVETETVTAEGEQKETASETSDEAENNENTDGNVFICPVCKKEYKSAAGLEKHMTAKHKEGE